MEDPERRLLPPKKKIINGHIFGLTRLRDQDTMGLVKNDNGKYFDAYTW
jgi:hypothetical protein